MADPHFFFALEFASQGVPAPLLSQLASQVLEHLGCAPESMAELPAKLQEAVAAGTAEGQRRCDVQFRTRGGQLEVVVVANGGRVWQISRPLP